MAQHYVKLVSQIQKSNPKCKVQILEDGGELTSQHYVKLVATKVQS